MDNIDVPSMAAKVGAYVIKTSLEICVLGSAKSPQINARTEAFAQRGHKVRMISPLPGNPTNIDIQFPGKPFGSGILAKFYLLVWTSIALLKQRADVFHAHYAAEVGTWLAALLRRRPLVISVMGGDVLFDEQGSLGLVGRWLTRHALRRADLVTVKTRQLAETVAKFGVAKDRIKVVIWGADLDVFKFSQSSRAAYRDNLDIAPNCPVVFSPRFLAPFYNMEIMVDAWPQVLRTHGDAVLLISEKYSEPGFQKHLAEKIDALGLAKSVLFAPPLSLTGMAAAFSAADAVISIPPSDGYPQAVLEAAACERPLILSDLPHLYGLLEPDKDALYTTMAVNAVADAITKTLSDAEGARTRAKHAFAKVTKQANFSRDVDRVEVMLMELGART